MREVVVLGVGMTPFGVHNDLSLRELFSMAALDAMDASGIGPKEVEGLFVGQCLGVFEEGQANIAPFLASDLGLPTEAPASRFEGACASATVAIRHGALMVAGGAHDLVLCGGVERAMAMDTTLATTTFAMSSQADFECPSGITFPGVFALAANLYASKYKVKMEDLKMAMAKIAVKNHRHAMENPLAQFHKLIDVDTVLGGPMIADPLQLFDCCPFSDGAAAVVIAAADKYKDRLDPAVYIAGMGQGHAGGLYSQSDMTLALSRRASVQTAYRQAGIGPQDVDVCELHDCFTIAEIIASEALGFFADGEGWRAAMEEKTTLGKGRPVVNPSGGLKAKGHPIGATGAGQTFEVVNQLRGLCGARQVEGAKIGLVDTLGGDFSTICNLVLRRG